MDRQHRDDFIAIAKIGRYRGTRGEVFIHPYLDLRVEEIDGKAVRILPQRGEPFDTVCERLWWHGKKAICSLACSTSIDEARALVHAEIQILRSDLAPLDEDEFYAADIVGMQASTVDGGRLGEIKRLLTAGGQSTLVIGGDRGEILVPFVSAIVVEVDPQEGRVLVDPPPGLLEINEN